MRTQEPNFESTPSFAGIDVISAVPKAMDFDSMLVESIQYFTRAEYNLALPYTLEQIETFRKHNASDYVLAAFFLLTMVYEQAGNFPGTIDILPYVIENLSTLPASDAVVKTQAALGRLYFLLQDHDQAITYYSKALEMQHDLSSKSNLAMLYKYMADAYAEKKDLQAAHEYAQKSINHCSHKTQPFLQAGCLNTMGGILLQKGQAAAAMRKFQLASVIAGEMHYEQVCALFNMGKWLLQHSAKEKGLIRLLRAYELARKHCMRAKLVEIILELAGAYKENQSYQLAAEFFEMYIDVKETLSMQAFAAQLRHLETAQKIEIINKRNHQLRHEIQEKIQNQAQLEVLATTDPLTGLFNRRHFFTLTEHWCENSGDVPLEISAMMIDIDHFKQVNDSYGHQAGDQALVQVARAIQNMLRNDDVLCRYGGEEFCILLPNTNLKAAQQVGERIRQKIEKLEIKFGEHLFQLTISIGIADLANSPKHSVMGLLGHADQALYKAKHKGRNRCAVYSSS